MMRMMAKGQARGSDGKRTRSLPSGEPGGLSSRMRELILGFTAEERRKRRDGDGAGGKRRRRSDHTNNAPHRES